MKRLICAPEVPASQMVLTIITDEQLEAFADAVITKYQQTIVRHKAAEKPQEEWMTRKEVMALLKRCDSTMTKWARRGYLVPSMVGGKHLYRKADVMRILNGGRKQLRVSLTISGNSSDWQREMMRSARRRPHRSPRTPPPRKGW